MNDDTVMMLAATAEAYDETTGEHLLGIRHITELLAAELGFCSKDVRTLGLASVLHDLGKIRLPREILLKPSALTPDERILMQHHSEWGEALLRDRVGFELASKVARWHHERWDGGGYPDGLRGEQIPREVAIVTVADLLRRDDSESPL
jgi:putative two-component system response regulator